MSVLMMRLSARFSVLVVVGLVLPATLQAGTSAVYWVTIERIKYATNQPAFVGVAIATEDVYTFNGQGGRLQVRLKATSPSRSISAIGVDGEVTCDNSDVIEYGAATQTKTFSLILRPGGSASLPIIRLKFSSCQWSLTVRGQPMPRRPGFIHRMTLEVSATSSVRHAVLSRPSPGPSGTYYDREECTIFKGFNSTTRGCRRLIR
jgi:hypothetical protein